ncbi:bifunctional 3,4-dihydroxy-2-butanone-4-phosphate synthase/GTP cyclohydrolase II [Corynebacterium cystitidis]|uniref:bifunctional 3,4-dihydroxy-2-butanone-4-phosphate synthase/GTP cyclohydrolase II n=1 Tax=Corynebacterium cystitidis TaxID=35757 RepID=UPI00211F2CF4|nr:bifunctional 3,4-dihydroxy-2-butanone-4-phosphate synthase/GTP cyclohydrolase II [Corynebacterium cystitidis]
MTESTIRLDSIDDAIVTIARGGAVVVVDDEGRENEGDLIFAADKSTPEMVAFMVRYTSGFVCVAMEDQRADALNLPPMVARNEDARSTAYTITVDANTGTTGISAQSRSETITRLADPACGPEDFTRPGHVVPLRARRGGVLARDGHTEAAVDLAFLAGLEPVGVLCEIVSEDDPTDMARAPELRRFADKHGLPMISIEQLIEYRKRTETLIERVTTVQLPTEFGSFTAHGYIHMIDTTEHIALVAGDVHGGSDVLVRVHSECLTGDVFASTRCDCGQQLHESLRRVQEVGVGVVVYVRGHEGRGVGLMNKLHAYKLQDEGLDTVDANLEQGLPADAREYSVAGQILADLGLESFQLMTNNPLKTEALAGYGPKVTGRVRVEVVPSHDNIRYLRTKRDRMGHDLPAVDQWDIEHE